MKIKIGLTSMALMMTAGAFVVTPRQTVSVTYHVSYVDKVERQFRGLGQSKFVLGIFSTKYTVNEAPVTTREFWNTIKVGDKVQAKIVDHRIFSILVTGNLVKEK